MTRLPAVTSGLFLLSALLLALGCKPEPKVSQYEVKSEATAAAPAPAPAAAPAAPVAASTPAPANMPASAAMKAEAAGFSEPKWATLPSGWSLGAPNAMRKATFVITGQNGAKAEVAVTVFPGSVGGLTANVNRWRGQLGLPPAGEQEITASAKPAKVGPDAGQRFVMVSGDGAKATDAVLVAKDGATWFFKLSGDAAVVSAAGDAFVKFLSASQIP